MSSPAVAITGAASLLAAITLVVAPAIALLAVLPSSLGYWRVGPESFNLSIADVALGAAFVAALPYVPWRAARVRRFGRLLAVYLGVLALTVVATLSQRSVLELGHRAFLVGCAVAVGAAIHTRGLTRSALRAFVAMAVVVSIAAVVDTATQPWVNDLPAPAYPFGMQKNPAGLLIALGVLVLVVAQRTIRLPAALRGLALTALFVGMAACQSRGAAIALVVVLIAWLVHTGRVVRSPLVLVGLVALVAMTWVSFDALFSSDEADSRFNSINARLWAYDSSLEVWRDEPVAGAGLKFWRDGAVTTSVPGGVSEPHNLVVSALGESGVVGLAGLVVLVVGTTVLLGRRKDELTMLAATALWAKVLAGVFDIFWVAGTMTVPWIAVGIAFASHTEVARGGLDLREHAARLPSDTPERSVVPAR